MKVSSPHYLLFSQSSEERGLGHWRFVLEAIDGSDRLIVDDAEPDLGGERLELFTVVRGLEALDQPSRVTLISPSTHIREGIHFGLPQWRTNGWRWECFGQMVPVKNLDLWRRIERALEFHELDCRTLRFDSAHVFPSRTRPVSRQADRKKVAPSSGRGSDKSLAIAAKRGLQWLRVKIT